MKRISVVAVVRLFCDGFVRTDQVIMCLSVKMFLVVMCWSAVVFISVRVLMKYWDNTLS